MLRRVGDQILFEILLEWIIGAHERREQGYAGKQQQ
jgi:hypothetical protein